MKKILFLIFASILFTSCLKEFYTYYNYEDMSYAYSQKKFEGKDLDKLIKQYKAIVDRPRGKSKMPPPGSCADYAFLLHKKGQKEESNKYFEKEMTLYPESKVYVEQLMKLLE